MEIIDTLTQRLNTIIVKIVSISDDVLKQQLHDEYLEVEDMINEKTNILYTESLHQELYLMYISQLEYYKTQYTVCSLTDLLPNTSIQRLRQLTTLSDKRTLIPFLQANNLKLIVKDMELVTIDIIGNGSNIFKVNVYCLSKYTIDLQTCRRIII